MHDPFVPGSGYVVPTNYNQILNFDDVIGYIEIPKISVKLPIYHTATESVLEKGVGHIPETAFPIGGKNNNSVLTGHRGLPHAELFTNLDKLKKGDIFNIFILDEILAYKVYETKIILPNALDSLKAITGRDLITLVTCTPYGVNTHRLLVMAERTEYIASEKEKTETINLKFLGVNIYLQYFGVIIGVVILLIGLIILNVIKSVKRKKR